MGSRVAVVPFPFLPPNSCGTARFGYGSGVILAGEEAPRPSSANATSASYPSHLPAVLACDFCHLGPGEPASLLPPVWVSHGKWISCRLIGATFMG